MITHRHMEGSGLIITHFGGKHTYDDAMNALEELQEMLGEKDEVYEIILHSDDLKTTLSKEQEAVLREQLRHAYRNYNRGAIAFVSNKDWMYGACRQFEIMMENEKIAISVFRSEELARKWIDEIKFNGSMDLTQQSGFSDKL